MQNLVLLAFEVCINHFYIENLCFRNFFLEGQCSVLLESGWQLHYISFLTSIHIISPPFFNLKRNSNLFLIAIKKAFSLHKYPTPSSFDLRVPFIDRFSIYVRNYLKYSNELWQKNAINLASYLPMSGKRCEHIIQEILNISY